MMARKTAAKPLSQRRRRLVDDPLRCLGVGMVAILDAQHKTLNRQLDDFLAAVEDARARITRVSTAADELRAGLRRARLTARWAYNADRPGRLPLELLADMLGRETDYVREGIFAGLRPATLRLVFGGSNYRCPACGARH